VDHRQQYLLRKPFQHSAVMSEIIPSFTFRCIRTPFSLSTSSTYSFPSLSVFKTPMGTTTTSFFSSVNISQSTLSPVSGSKQYCLSICPLQLQLLRRAVIFVFATGEILSTTPKTSTSSLMASPVILTSVPLLHLLYCIRLPWPLPLACQD